MLKIALVGTVAEIDPVFVIAFAFQTDDRLFCGRNDGDDVAVNRARKHTAHMARLLYAAFYKRISREVAVLICAPCVDGVALSAVEVDDVYSLAVGNVKK